MIVINGTNSVKVMMTDRGDMISILAKDQSEVMIASKNLITAAMQLGTPDEIAIVLNGSYEIEIATKITGSTPYICTNIDEARNRVIDNTIDYKSSVNTDLVNAKLETEVTEKNKYIVELEEKIVGLTKSLEEKDSEGSKDLDILKVEVQKRDKTIADLREEKMKLNTQIKDNEDTISDLELKVKDLSSKYGELNQELSGYKSSAIQMEEEKRELLAKLDSNGADSEMVKELEEKVSKLTDNLKKSGEVIESMKNEFNAACHKFGLQKVDGEWIQTSEAGL